MEQGIDVKKNRVGALGNIMMFSVQGFVDTNTCLDLGKHINDVIQQGIYNFVFDLGAVSYVSSAGWGVFVGEIRDIRENGGDLKIVQMMPDVYEVFEMLEFNKILNYYDNIEEAINDFDYCLGYDLRKSIKRTTKQMPVTKVEIPKVSRENVVPADKDERAIKALKPGPKPRINEAILPLPEKIRIIIIDNPLHSLIQIRKILNTRRFGFTKIGMIKLYQILKKNNWETEEKRKRFYRSR